MKFKDLAQKLEEEKTKECPKCGYKCKANTKICPNCGHKFKMDEAKLDTDKIDEMLAYSKTPGKRARESFERKLKSGKIKCPKCKSNKVREQDKKFYPGHMTCQDCKKQWKEKY